MNNQNNPQQDTEMSLEALEKKYSQMNAQQRMQNNPYAQYIPNMQNNANVQVNAGAQTNANAQPNAGAQTGANVQPNPGMQNNVNVQPNVGVQPNMNVQPEQNFQNDPFGQINPNMQVPQTMGGINKKWLYIGGAVVAALLLITLANYKMTHSQPEDPTIGVSTTEYASQDTSTVVEEKTEAVEKEDSEVAEEVSDKSDEEASDSNSSGHDVLKDRAPYEVPEYDGDTFISHSVGIKFNKPSNYTFLSKEELAGGDGSSSDDFDKKLKEDIDSSKPRTEMLAETELTDANIGITQLRVIRNIGIIFLKYAGKTEDEIIEQFCESESREDQIQKDKDYYLSTYEQAKDVDITVSKGEFCGRPAIVKDIQITLLNGAGAHTKEFKFIKNDFMGYVSVLCMSESDCEKTIACYSAVE
ncbi:hypothetical protein D6856_00975 [Butyrivibrio sp. XB500-5]|uniref:hypothetical protein n=1 Tax=Butyrivibrio sp. XB500-5 TaxID=2364880 RepID=UPI000EA9C2ED|nr:hypothetical protein [Butyrivibrio sp. XB500-5]RKM62726.1 hypothetical protein D6856_00975 [Butyrivibrio sp. XB500-5]